jgi:hypothetical protein
LELVPSILLVSHLFDVGIPLIECICCLSGLPCFFDPIHGLMITIESSSFDNRSGLLFADVNRSVRTLLPDGLDD